MGWDIGWDDRHHRDIGYGVPATCDHPGCEAVIHRGLAYACGAEHGGGDDGCGLYFCADHLLVGVDGKERQVCERCARDAEPFEPKPDVREWVEWKLSDPSWQRWRDENPVEVSTLRARLATVD